MKHRISILLAALAAISVCSFAARRDRKQEPYDFYKASKAYYEKVTSRNWKDRDKAIEKIRKDAMAFDEPIATWQLAVEGFLGEGLEGDRLKAFLDSGRDRLQSSSHPDFYGLEKYRPYPDFIKDGFRSDYEYVLWTLAGSYGSDKEFASGLLKEHLDGRYPETAYLEYTEIPYGDSREDALKEFAGKYSGKAVALLAERDLLHMSKNRLESSEEFMDLRKKCVKFEKLRSSYRGKEAAIAGDVREIKEMIDELDAKDIRQYIDNDTVFVLLRNLGEVDIELLKGFGEERKSLWKTGLDNDVRSYYAFDTLRCVLPAMDDAEDYTIVCRSGRVETQGRLSRSSISFARRDDGKGYAIYAADSRTGKPLEKADLILKYKGEVQKVVRDFIFDGFTPLDEGLVSLIEGNMGTTVIECSYKDAAGFLRESNSVNFYNPANYGEGPAKDDVTADAELFLDRAAYNPGDTLRFKAVLYSAGRKSGKMSVFAEGRECTVVVLDKDGKDVTSMVLATNAFGSVAGEAVLPGEVSANGRYSISVSCGGRTLDTAYFIVDEFVLPTYTISFEKDGKYHYPGDTIAVRGEVASYTGHPLSSASVTYSVSYDGFRQDGRLVLARDGSFEIVFESDDADPADYMVSVKVVDVTGETAEASRHVRAGSFLYISAEVEEEADGRVDFVRYENYPPGRYCSTSIVTGDAARVKFTVSSLFCTDVPKDLEYSVMSGKDVIASGRSRSGEFIGIDLPASGLYTVEAKSSYTAADGREVEIGYVKHILKLSGNDAVLNVFGVKNLFRKMESDGRVGVQFGTTDGPVWAIAELYDNKGNVLETSRIYLEGNAGKAGSVLPVTFEYKDEYPDAVAFRIFYFKDEDRFEYYTEFRRPEEDYVLPLEFVRFIDSSVPGGLAEFKVRTLPGVECVVSVFDKSTESIMRNVWSRTYPPRIPVDMNRLSAVRGFTYLRDMRPASVIKAGGVADRNLRLMGKASVNAPAADDAYMSQVVSEEASVDGFAGDLSDAEAGVAIRDDFRKTIAFLPFLRSGKDGYIDFSVVPSGKLSTYYVSLYAHDKGMRNAMLRREMTVTLPVKVSVAVPGFLYEGDTYRLKASVSNVSDTALDGVMTFYVYDNEDYRSSEPIAAKSVELGVKAGMDAVGEIEVNVPEGADVLGFKVVFAAKADGVGVSDGLFVKVAVKPAAQVLAESHSAVLPYGADKVALADSLEKAFVNTSAMGAEYKEISLKDMLFETLPEQVVPDGEDVVSRLGAYHANMLLKRISASANEEILRKYALGVRDCQNSDGGFGWFAGMKSSPVITAAVLETNALAGGLLDRERIAKAVQYLDGSYFIKETYWGRLSLGQYLYIRTMYADIPFTVKVGRKDMAAFRKDARALLMPAKADETRFDILSKARSTSVMLELAEPESAVLLKAWRSGSSKDMLRQVAANIETLAEYAVEHQSGGYYFPNAVMPFRGLLESELYAHTMLCRLFEKVGDTPGVKFDAARADAIADGIRIWMMVQKETQQWDRDPAYVGAVATVLDGGEEVLGTEVLTLTKKYRKPFTEIAAAGNGFTVDRKYYRAGDNAAGKFDESDELNEGDSLEVGDRIVAVYKVWSQENRSFVRITAPRCAALRPVQQLSGIIGMPYRPAPVSGKMLYYPQGYRNVRTDRTELYFDVLPEENTSFTEEFYVTQAGKFTSPSITVESLYAPHYRANAGFGGMMAVIGL